ncbi:glycoside hydrolase family 76 protein [Actinoallomurus sp. NPDC050550]|uniref:glycoside hydrolase family 76 protein n=1 Tax=Actinoallomurus sp. NPDC050550 TaxID=3154937 RepID=UPI0033DCE22B
MRKFLASSLAAATAILGAATPAQASDAGTRARQSYEALQRYLYQGPDEHGLYLENYPKQPADQKHSYVWPFREATAATVSIAETSGRYRKDVENRFATLQLYWNGDSARPGYESYLPPPLGGGGDIYYDDNAVIGLELIRGYEASGDRTLLQRAKQAFGVDTRAWDTDTSRPCPGGMAWVDNPANNIRAANVTGLASELATHLFRITHDRDYLAWGTRLYTWNRKCLQQSPGLYWNDIGYDGTVDKTLWSYNSGSMIGAATLLYQATGTRSYLDNALADANGALDHWTQGDNLYNQPAIFNAIFFNNLLLLDSVRPNPKARSMIEQYANREWSSNRDAATGLFHFQPSGGGAYDPAAPAQTLEQSAMVQIYAALAWKPHDLWRIA